MGDKKLKKYQVLSPILDKGRSFVPGCRDIDESIMSKAVIKRLVNLNPPCLKEAKGFPALPKNADAATIEKLIASIVEKASSEKQGALKQIQELKREAKNGLALSLEKVSRKEFDDKMSYVKELEKLLAQKKDPGGGAKELIAEKIKAVKDAVAVKIKAIKDSLAAVIKEAKDAAAAKKKEARDGATAKKKEAKGAAAAKKKEAKGAAAAKKKEAKGAAEKKVIDKDIASLVETIENEAEALIEGAENEAEALIETADNELEDSIETAENDAQVEVGDLDREAAAEIEIIEKGSAN